MQIVDHHSPSPTIARLSASPVFGIEEDKQQVKSGSKIRLGVAVYKSYSKFSYAFSPFVSSAMKPLLALRSKLKPALSKGAFSAMRYIDARYRIC